MRNWSSTGACPGDADGEQRAQMSEAVLNVRILLAVGVVIAVARAVAWLFGRWGQPPVLGEIVAGVLLGPSVLGFVLPAVEGYLFPAPVVDGLRTLSQFGLVLFVFLVGLEVDVRKLRGSGRTVTVVANASLGVPFALAVGFAASVHAVFGAGVAVLPFCLFLGAATAVTAFPVLARILQDFALANERVGVLSLVCAAVNDVAAWIVVAVVIAIASASEPNQAVVSLLLGVVFVALMLLLVRPLLAQWGEPPVWALITIAFLSAWIGEQIGVHAIIGGFLAGLVMPRRPEWQRAVTDRMSGVVDALLLPVFFAVVGIATRIDQLTVAGLALFAGVTAVAVVGKLGGASVAARLAGESWRDALTIGVLMNTRGITEIVILSTGLQLGLISSTVFTAMVLMALLTTLMAAPALRLVRPARRHTPLRM